MYQYTGNGAWSAMKELTGESSNTDLFGSSVAMAFDNTVPMLTVAVGAPGPVSTCGSVYIYRTEDNITWHLQQITFTEPGTFGSSLSLVDNMLVVADPDWDTQNGTCSWTSVIASDTIS